MGTARNGREIFGRDYWWLILIVLIAGQHGLWGAIRMGKQTRQKRRYMIRAGVGPGWSLWVPVATWDSFPAAEQQAMVARQAALLAIPEDEKARRGGRASNSGDSESGAIVPDLAIPDQAVMGEDGGK